MFDSAAFRASLLRHYPLLVWLALAYFTAVYLGEVSAGGEPWKTGDWLINYSGGPIRRGLVGALLFWLTPSAHALLWLVAALQVACYLVLFAVVLGLYRRCERELTWAALLFSPAYLLFPAHDLLAGFRKEILIFASFAFLARAYSLDRINRRTLGVTWALFLLCGLAYEITIFVLPFFIFLLRQAVVDGMVSQREGLAWVAGFVFAALGTTAFALLVPGTPDSRIEICTGLIQRGLDMEICGGAIAWLGLGLADAIREAARYFPNTLYVFPGLFMLAMLPIAASTWARQHASFLLLALASMVPMFVIALDWGRWIHIYVFMSSTLLLAISTRHEVGFPKWPVGLVIAYVGLWSVHHFLPLLGGGLLQFVLQMFL